MSRKKKQNFASSFQRQLVVDSVAHLSIALMFLANPDCFLTLSRIIENVRSSCRRKAENSHLLLQLWSFGGFTRGNVLRYVLTTKHRLSTRPNLTLSAVAAVAVDLGLRREQIPEYNRF